MNFGTSAEVSGHFGHAEVSWVRSVCTPSFSRKRIINTLVTVTIYNTEESFFVTNCICYLIIFGRKDFSVVKNCGFSILVTTSVRYIQFYTKPI